MRYSIIIANYNGRNLLDRCLSSLICQVEEPSSIIVVDNGSRDGSFSYLKGKWPAITTLSLPTNTGFTGANNTGAAETNSEFIVLLNTDTRVAPAWLENLLSPFRDPSVGAVTSSMRRMGDLSTMDSAGGGLDYLFYACDRGRGDSSSEWTTSDEILFPCGGAMALRRSSLNDRRTIFWNDLFLYNEDTDLGLRLWENGYRVVYQPEAVVEHAFSATAGSNSSVKIHYCTRNRILVLKRHLGPEFKKISSLLALWETLTLGFMLSRGEFRRFRASLKGSREGFSTNVECFSNPQKTRRIYARFMQPSVGTSLRKKFGDSVQRRLSSPNVLSLL
jgi:GT2 family glycosyltransferase